MCYATKRHTWALSGCTILFLVFALVGAGCGDPVSNCGNGLIDGTEEGIVRGIYRYRPAGCEGEAGRVRLLGSGTILNETIKARELLRETCDMDADIWSVTSYKDEPQDFHR